jgi:hypothetical protein
VTLISVLTQRRHPEAIPVVRATIDDARQIVDGGQVAVQQHHSVDVSRAIDQRGFDQRGGRIEAAREVLNGCGGKVIPAAEVKLASENRSGGCDTGGLGRALQDRSEPGHVTKKVKNLVSQQLSLRACSIAHTIRWVAACFRRRHPLASKDQVWFDAQISGWATRAEPREIGQVPAEVYGGLRLGKTAKRPNSGGAGGITANCLKANRVRLRKRESAAATEERESDSE